MSAVDPNPVESIFVALLHMSVDERPSALSRMCDGDEDLQREVESLLRFHEHTAAGALDRSPLLSLSAGLAASLDENSLPPQPTAGGFTLQSVLGSGGMGVVYVAEQHRPRRTVALKVIRPAAAQGALLRRFEHEAELLGRLQHPGIAQVYEAGIADFGHGAQPFIAMELVKGPNLLDFAKERNLSVRERLELITRIADAVQHAHQRGVIHRDLKPANILVETRDEDTAGRRDEVPAASGARGHSTSSVRLSISSSLALAQPKVLDFGVARATDADLAVSMQTSAGQLIGTLPYMSPEQVAADPDAVDTRSDVYALGVVLYQLLSDRLPHDLSGKSIADAARVIADCTPTMLGTLNSAFRGDIETIAAKAMEKERERRYPSASELAADIRRHLNDEPIVARPATTIYQIRKFIKRHRAMAGGLAIAVLALALGIAGTTRGMFEARQQRDDAVRSARIARAVNDFLNNDLLSQADPNNQPDRELTLREALDQAAATISGRFRDEPLVQATIRASLGRTYKSLGQLDQAETQLRAALALYRQELGDDDALSLTAESQIADALRLRGDYSTAESMCRRVIQAATDHYGANHDVTLDTQDVLAAVLEKLNRYDEAEALVLGTYAIRREKYGPQARETLASMRLIGLMYERNGKFKQAIEMMTSTIQATIATLGEEHPETLSAMNNLGLAYFGQQRYGESEELLRKVYTTNKRVMGERHNETLIAMSNLAVTLIGQKRYDEAEPLLVDKVRIVTEVLGPLHSDTLNARNSLAGLYYRTGRHDLEEPLLNETLQRARTAYGEKHLEAMVALAGLARMQLATRRYDEAQQNGDKAFALMSESIGVDHPITQALINYLVRIAKARNKPDEAALWEQRLNK